MMLLLAAGGAGLIGRSAAIAARLTTAALVGTAAGSTAAACTAAALSQYERRQRQRKSQNQKSLQRGNLSVWIVTGTAASMGGQTCTLPTQNCGGLGGVTG